MCKVVVVRQIRHLCQVVIVQVKHSEMTAHRQIFTLQQIMFMYNNNNYVFGINNSP